MGHLVVSPKKKTAFENGVVESSMHIVKIIEDYENDNSQNDKPVIFLSESEQAVVLYCDDELWQYILEVKNSNIDKMGIQDVAKIWLKLKKILKKQTTVI